MKSLNIIFKLTKTIVRFFNINPLLFIQISIAINNIKTHLKKKKAMHLYSRQRCYKKI